MKGHNYGEICKKCGKYHNTNSETLKKMYKDGYKHPMTGKHHTKEAKLKISQNKERGRKISKALKGRKFTEEHREKIRIAKTGTHHSEETLIKLSKSHKGLFLGDKNPARRPEVREKIRQTIIRLFKENPDYSRNISETLKKIYSNPENTPNWQGGKSFEPYTPEFNRQLKIFIRTRDNFTCQFPDCGVPENGRAHCVHHVDHNKKNCDQKNLITLCASHNQVVEKRKYRNYWIDYFKAMVNNI